MKYIMLNDFEQKDSCGFRFNCECKGTSCYKEECGVDMCGLNKDNVCPNHCWAQMCNSAKVDPFSVIE